MASDDENDTAENNDAVIQAEAESEDFVQENQQVSDTEENTENT